MNISDHSLNILQREWVDQKQKVGHARSVTDTICCASNLKDIDEGVLKSVYGDFGYLVIRVDEPLTVERVSNFFLDFGLGRPIVPGYYEKSLITYRKGFNEIRVREDGLHRGFSTGSYQDIHVDGTLCEIGAIRTSALFCERRASSGGASILVHSCRAFLDAIFSGSLDLGFLVERDCLMRKAVDLDGSNVVGPAFGRDGKELLTRYSVDNTSSWTGLSESERASLCEFHRLYLDTPVYRDDSSPK